MELSGIPNKWRTGVEMRGTEGQEFGSRTRSYGTDVNCK